MRKTIGQTKIRRALNTVLLMVGGGLVVGCDGGANELFGGAAHCSGPSDCASGHDCENSRCIANDAGPGEADREDASVRDSEGSTPAGPCIPKTCVTIGVLGGGTSCGKPWDGCGNYIDCGECAGPNEVCGAPQSASPNICIDSGDGGVPDAALADDAGIDSGADSATGSACAVVKRTGEPAPLDMYLMLDKTGSMTEGGRWTAVTNAIRSFVDSDDARGAGIGIAYYPVPWKKAPPPPPQNCTSSADCLPHWGDCMPFMNVCEGALVPGGMADSCVAEDYEQPAAGIKLLPMAGDGIKSSLNATKPNGDSTPTLPALEGAHRYAKAWAANNPGHVTVVILATDGEPNNCGAAVNNTTNIAQAAADAYTTSPSIPTFVIGVGDKAGDLYSVAQAGGTTSPVYVSASNAYAGVLDALHEIRNFVRCDFRIPTPTDGADLDYDRINLEIVKDGETKVIGRVATAAQCEPLKGGWYYNDPGEPSRIRLCQASCDLVTSGSPMNPVEVDILLGCDTATW